MEMIKIEQHRKLNAITVDENKMLKWIITDKCDNLKYTSDPVSIDNYKFVFYAERWKKEYSGLKIFTALQESNTSSKSQSISNIARNTSDSEEIARVEKTSKANNIVLNTVHDLNKMQPINNRYAKIHNPKEMKKLWLTIYSQLKWSVKK